jgi:hypothetical protein
MASVNWKSAASGGRTVASNWDSGNVPGTSDDVFISVAGSHTVSLIAAITVASITIGDASAVPQIQNPGGDDVVTGNLDGGGSVGVDAIGAGGSTLTIGGTLTDGNAIQVGNGGMTTSDLLTVGGTFGNPGGVLTLEGGQTGAAAQMVVTGAVPGTLTGNYSIVGEIKRQRPSLSMVLSMVSSWMPPLPLIMPTMLAEPAQAAGQLGGAAMR